MGHFIAVFIIMVPSVCHAYVGPGLGIGVVLATVGALLALLLALFGFLFYPIKNFLKTRLRKKNKGHENP